MTFGRLGCLAGQSRGTGQEFSAQLQGGPAPQVAERNLALCTAGKFHPHFGKGEHSRDQRTDEIYGLNARKRDTTLVLAE